MEDMLMRLAGNIGIINLPFISLVFKKEDIDTIANDSDTYQRLMTSKCPMSIVRSIILDGLNKLPIAFYNNSYHCTMYDDDNINEIEKCKYISDCLEERVSDYEISVIRKMLSDGNSDITKYILSIFLRRILKTDDEISEIDDLILNITPFTLTQLEQITTPMMSKYNLYDKLPQVELIFTIFFVKYLFVPLIISNETTKFTKRSLLFLTFRVSSKHNSFNIPIGNIILLMIRIPAYLEDDPKYVWGVGIDHRCCRTREFSIDFIEKLNKSKNPN
jgi:hypothetical protein